MMWQVFIPGRPVSWNRYFAGEHWARRRAQKQRAEWDVVAAIREKCPEPPRLSTPATIIITAVYRNRRHRLDADNICAKPYIDALVHLGMLPDDSPDYVTRVVTQVLTDSSRAEGVHILVMNSADFPYLGLDNEGTWCYNGDAVANSDSHNGGGP